MATQNALNNSSQELTLDPGASGDSFIQFNINTTGEFRIGVDDTDDSFRISQGSALGTSDTFVITAAGERTMPLQSAFSAYNSVTDSNVTGNASAFQLEFDTEIFDQNGDYNNSTDTFTAPVTGRYQLVVMVKLEGLVAGNTLGNIRFITSNRTYVSMHMGYGAVRNASNELSFAYRVLADMDASDTATATIIASNGSKVTDVYGGATPIQTCFMGYLVC